jgi:hypothetical protein
MGNSNNNPKAVVPATTTKTEFTVDAEAILQEAILVSKGVSADVIRHTAQFVNRLSKSEEGKKNNQFAIAQLSDKDKEWVKRHCFDYYLNYNIKSLNGLRYLKILGLKEKQVYNLKLVVEKFESYLETTLRNVGIIDSNNNVLMPDVYKTWYNQCRLFLNDQNFAKEFKVGPLVVINEHETRAASNSFIPRLKEKFPATVDTKKHARLTVAKIQSVYENALGIKITDDMFAYNVA